MKRAHWTGPLLWMGLACGGTQPKAETPPGPSVESQAGEDFEQQAAASEEPEAAAEDESWGAEPEVTAAPERGPSTIRVDVSANGEPLAADIRILDGDQEVASGSSGQAITAQSGDYTLLLEVKDGLVDKPTRRSALTLLPDGNVTEEVEFPWARIQLEVLVNGAHRRSAKVDVMRHGVVVATLRSGAQHVFISPGRYQAVVKVGGAKIEVPEVLFPAEATQTVPIRVQLR